MALAPSDVTVVHDNGQGSETITIPSSVVAGDVLVLLNWSSQSTAPPDGFTKLDSEANRTGNLVSSYRMAVAGDAGTSVSIMDPATLLVMPGQGINAHAGNSGPTAAQVTTSVDGCLIVEAFYDNASRSVSRLQIPDTVIDPAHGYTQARHFGVSAQAQASAGTSAQVSVGGVRACVSATVAITPAPQVPAPPTLTAPDDGAYLDPNDPGSFSWTVASGQGQSAYRFRRQAAGGSYEWWNGSAWVSTETAVTDAADAEATVSVTPTDWSDGTYTWSVATKGADSGLWGDYASPRTVYFAEPPTVEVTEPTGDVLSTSPNVGIIATPASGQSLSTATLEVFDEATYSASGFDPDTSTVAYVISVILPRDGNIVVQAHNLLRSTTYRAYVSVTQSPSGERSSWEYTQFTIVVPPVDTPTVTASYDPDDSGAPRIRLDLHWDRTDPWVSGLCHFFLGWKDGTDVASDPSDATGWQTLPSTTSATGEASPASDNDGNATVYDPLVVGGLRRTYRLVLLAVDGDETRGRSDVVYVSITPPSDPPRAWLTHWETSTTVQLHRRSGDDFYPPVREQVLSVIERTDKVRIWQTPNLPEGQMTVLTRTADELDDLLSLLRSDNTLYLRLPADTDGQPGQASWVQVTGAAKPARLFQGRGPLRSVPVSFIGATSTLTVDEALP